jgi:hypothetical protein
MEDTTSLDQGELSTIPNISASKLSDILVSEAVEPDLLIYEPSIIGMTGPTQLVWDSRFTITVKEAKIHETEQILGMAIGLNPGGRVTRALAV